MYQLRKQFVALKEILEGKHDNLPEEAFRSVGKIEDAIEKRNN